MQITDQEEKFIVKCSPATAASEVVSLMMEQDVGCVVVVEDEEPIGLITDRDLVVEVLNQRLDPKDVKAEEIMTDDIVTADASENLFKLIEKLETNSVRRLPIVKNGRLVNIVTLDDLNRLLVKQLGLLNRVAEAESPFRVMRSLFENGE